MPTVSLDRLNSQQIKNLFVQRGKNAFFGLKRKLQRRKKSPSDVGKCFQTPSPAQKGRQAGWKGFYTRPTSEQNNRSSVHGQLRVRSIHQRLEMKFCGEKGERWPRFMRISGENHQKMLKNVQN